MVTCSCPASTALPSIPAKGCGENFGQIQKFAFTRLFKEDGSRNSFTAQAAITLLASWQPKLVANDSTKIVVTPIVDAPTQDGGDPITFGGGNDTPGGVERIIGRNPMNMTVSLREYPQALIKALKALQCEENLGVFPINGDGQLEAIADPATEGTFYPVPIRSFFVGDKTHGGFNDPDSNVMRFSFLPNYSDDLKVVTPEFNALTDLIPAA